MILSKAGDKIFPTDLYLVRAAGCELCLCLVSLGVVSLLCLSLHDHKLAAVSVLAACWGLMSPAVPPLSIATSRAGSYRQLYAAATRHGRIHTATVAQGWVLC